MEFLLSAGGHVRALLFKLRQSWIPGAQSSPERGYLVCPGWLLPGGSLHGRLRSRSAVWSFASRELDLRCGLTSSFRDRCAAAIATLVYENSAILVRSNGYLPVSAEGPREEVFAS